MKRRVVLESVCLMLLVGALIFLGARTRSEATARLQTVERPQPSELPTPLTAAKRLLAIAAHYASEPPLRDLSRPREFRVDVLRNQSFLLVCKAENAELAIEVCNRAVKEASATGLFVGIGRARATTPIGRRLFDAAWPALLAAIGWFFVRTSFKPHSGIEEVVAEPEPSGEWKRWTPPRRRPSTEDTIVNRPKPAQASSQRPIIVNTIMGMPALRPAGGPQLAASEFALPARRSPPLDTRTTARMIRVPAQAARVRSEAPRPVTTPPPESERRRISTTPDLSRRVLYHVSAGRWTADPNVVTDEVLAELASLRNELAPRAKTRCYVIRVTSSSNGRRAKTQVAAQLAWLLAEREAGQVLLMEADLDSPALHAVLRLNIPRGFGFSEQLERMADDEEFAGPPTVMRIRPGLHVLVEGRAGSKALFDSPQFSAALAQLRGEHAFIVIDGPVVDAWPDTQAMQGVADAVVFAEARGAEPNEALANRHFEHHPMLRFVKTGR